MDPQRDRCQLGPVHPGREHAERGRLLDLVRSADDCDRRPADEDAGLEHASQRGRHVLERADVMGGREAHGEIASLATELFEDLAPHLAHCLGCDRMLRERRRERGHGAGIAVIGTTTLDPDSVIVHRASIVPGSGNSSSGRTSR